jgi:PiT family inorganic phosphate transporter
MGLELLALAGIGFMLAYANGANDVSKGIATLVGSGLARYRPALIWGAAWTTAGGVCGAILAQAMVSTFGSGILKASVTPTIVLGLAALAGSTAWVLLATRLSWPVSTTHAIVGSLTGVALAAYGPSAMQWSALVGRIALPLVLTPLISLVLVSGVLSAASRVWPAMPDRNAPCLCLVPAREPILSPALASGLSALPAAAGWRVKAIGGPLDACVRHGAPVAMLTTRDLHWLTSGMASFARGLNDAPKIVALLLAAGAAGSPATRPRFALFALVAGGMLAGSLVAGRRVTRVLAEDLTPLSHRQGFAANLVTAVLVTFGAIWGLPMSTTHVAAGGIAGAGAWSSSLHYPALREMALAWVITLPAAALLGLLAYVAGLAFLG